MSDADERTIPATPRRRELARRRGVMPTAAQPAWVAAAATAVILLPAWSRATFPAATEMMRGALLAAVADGGGTGPRFDAVIPVSLLLPTAAVVAAAGIVGLSVRLLLDGGGWRLERAAPSFERLDILAGLARIFSARTAAAAATSAAGLTVVTAVALGCVGPLVAALGSPESATDPALLVPPARRLLVAVAAGSAAVAAGQFVLARLRFERHIRMTPQEFADESRSMQAAPRVRMMQHRRATTSPRSGPAAGDSSAGLRAAVEPR